MFDGDLAHNFEIGHISYVALVSVSVHMCVCSGWCAHAFMCDRVISAVKQTLVMITFDGEV